MSVIKLINHSVYGKFRFPILTNVILILFLNVACDFSLRKELDIEILSIEPKLSVTAILNGGSGIFDIKLKEGISLAEYNKTSSNKAIIRDGEIRLYEDGAIILTLPGPFDMSQNITDSGEGWKVGRNGYHYVTNGINTRPGSIYRLEVEVEGYPMAVSTSAMPVAPAVSASMDTSVQVIRKNVKEIGVAGYWLHHLGGFEYEKYPGRYWSFSVSVDAPGENNHFVLDAVRYDNNSLKFWGIGGSDVSVLLENGMNRELVNIENADLYLFSILMATDFKGALRNFYTAAVEIPNNPEIKNTATQHSVVLRVRNITPATHRYYHSLSLQSAENIFNEQPATVVGNIEGGYGIFSVYNTTSIPLLEWETYE